MALSRHIIHVQNCARQCKDIETIFGSLGFIDALQVRCHCSVLRSRTSRMLVGVWDSTSEMARVMYVKLEDGPQPTS